MKATVIRQKDIHVMTLAVINLKHHRGAAAERPIIDDGFFRVHLANERASDPKEPGPIWLPV
jgi:hypothetical protein